LTLSMLACARGSDLQIPAADTQRFEPASTDPPRFDETDPPRLVETIFEVEGVGMNAIVYEAQGSGPHPTVVLLHGFPGNERNLDLAQAIRRAGWNVVFFHYRSAWGSGGEFSFVHVIEDVAAVVAAISAPTFAAAHRIDPEHIALVGHSMGGFAALITGAELTRVDCVVSMAGANLGGLVRILADSPDQAATFAASLDAWSGPIKGLSGKDLIEQISVNVDRFDTIARVDVLAQKNLLLIAGGRDVVTPATAHHSPLVEALESVGAVSLETTVFDQADHSFSGQRIALAIRVTDWLETACAKAD
jgi:pimeloyl-ACP methyl ester carboxylesterase